MLPYRKCKIEGCNNMARNRGGQKRGTLCDKHHLRQYPKWKLKKRLEKLPCQKCGWNLAPCDIHRIIPGSQGGKYTTDNVIVLCPNCHRLIHRGKFAF